MKNIDRFSNNPSRIALVLVLLFTIALQQRGKFTLEQLEDFKAKASQITPGVRTEFDKLFQTDLAAYSVPLSEIIVSAEEWDELVEFLGNNLEEFDSKLRTIELSSFFDGNTFSLERADFLLQAKLWISQYRELYNEVIFTESVLWENDGTIEAGYPVAVSQNGASDLRELSNRLTSSLEKYIEVEEDFTASSLLTLIEMITAPSLLILSLIPSVRKIRKNGRKRELDTDYDVRLEGLFEPKTDINAENLSNTTEHSVAKVRNRES